MNNKQVRHILKKNGIILASTGGSRVAGWSSYGSCGFEFSFYPWAQWYVKNGYRVKSIIPDRSTKATLSWTDGFAMRSSRERNEKVYNEQMKIVRKTLTDNGIKYTEKEGEFTFQVDNPYTVKEVERAEQAWHRAVRTSR